MTVFCVLEVEKGHLLDAMAQLGTRGFVAMHSERLPNGNTLLAGTIEISQEEIAQNISEFAKRLAAERMQRISESN